jgi:type I restriction enzyme R subunit
VLTYIAYGSQTPGSKKERVIKHKDLIFFEIRKNEGVLDFILDQYIRSGVGELDRRKCQN